MVATFPGAGSPPALRGPSGRWLEHPISTTFRWYDATRHRRPRERIRRRLWTRPCGKVAVRRGVPHHSSSDQDHKLGRPQPCGHPHVRPPPLTRSPPVQAPVIERGRRAVDPHPSRTGHVQSRDRPRRRTPLQRGQNRIEWFVRSRPGSRKRYPAHMTRKRPPGHYPVSPSRSHKQNRSTRPPPTPAQPGDTLFPTTRSRSVHAVCDRVPSAGASRGHPFSRRTSTVLSTNKYRSREQ